MIDPRNLVQRTEEWKLARCGSLGASQVRDALATLKRTGERTKVAEDLMYEIAAERLTHVPARQVSALKWGMDHEAEARAMYAFLTNLPVLETGLIPHPKIANSHASVDGLVGDDGALEIKAPTSATHLRTLLEQLVPEDHLLQIHWAMACTGRAWVDFVSFDPRFPEALQYFQKRVARNEPMIATMENQVRAYLAELEEKLKWLDQLYPMREDAYDATAAGLRSMEESIRSGRLGGAEP